MDVKLMEIVAPAGDRASLEAAVHAGADSVYMGLKGFGARRKAKNFNLEEFIEAIDYSHLRGVRVYLTLNTLMKDREIEAITPNLIALYEAGLDAFIVQDIGVFKFLKENFPDVEIHASTQMKIVNSVEAKFLCDEGFSRVIPARELSHKELESIKKKSGVSLEVFVSGARCISYSGSCYLSSFVGGRSGNRGMCAQPCRKLYENGEESGYFLSPKDQLLGFEEIEILKKIGVDSIKIEGRMKDSNYVFETVRYYRELVDGVDTQSNTEELFNRGYSKSFFYGETKELINRKNPSHIGVKVGEVKGKMVKLIEEVVTGDGIVYVDKDINKLEGSYINKIDVASGRAKIGKKDEYVSLGEIPKGAKFVYRNYNKALMDKIKLNLKSYEKKMGISGELVAITGQKLKYKLEYRDIIVEVFGEELEEAKNRVASSEELQTKFSAIGNSTFYIKEFNLEYDEKSFVPLKELKRLKRESLELFGEKVINLNKREFGERTICFKKGVLSDFEETEITASVATEEQYDACKKFGIEKVYIRDENIVNESRLKSEKEDKILVRNFGDLTKISKEGASLDWNMNVINSYAIDYFGKFENLETLYLSPEISESEIRYLAESRLKLGYVVYGKLEVMTIEKSLFKDGVEIIENENGDRFRVKTENGRSRLYLTESLNLIPRLDELSDLGISEARLDFYFETEDEIKKVVESVEKRSGELRIYNYEKGVF